jgi:bifunctional non-homologous end joining protein LigD
LKKIIAQLKNERKDFTLNVNGYQINISNLDKELWPAASTRRAGTKRDLLVYLAEVSPYILPHLYDRPLTMTRYPNGITGEKFYQRHVKPPQPEFLESVELAEEGGKDNYLLCNNLATLLWMGQVASIDIHTWFSRITPEPGIKRSGSDNKKPSKPEKQADYFSNFPDFIVFDIDPYIYSGKESKGEEPELNRRAFNMAGKAAFWLKEELESLKLHSFIKTSGRTGLHIFAPVVRHYDFDEVRAAARTICEAVHGKHPDEITIDWAVEKRTGKIFLDFNQNVRGKNLASVYSPRPAPGAPVSTPLRWEEIGKVYPTSFSVLTLPKRLAEVGDLWADILKKPSDLKAIVGTNKT